MRERREAAEFKGAGAQPHKAPVPQLGQPGDRSGAPGYAVTIAGAVPGEPTPAHPSATRTHA